MFWTAPQKITHSYHPQRPLSKVQQAPKLLPLMDEAGTEGHQHHDVQEVMHAKEDLEAENQPWKSRDWITTSNTREVRSWTLNFSFGRFIHGFGTRQNTISANLWFQYRSGINLASFLTYILIQISVTTTGTWNGGPQLQAPDFSGHCQTSTRSSRSQ